MPGEWIRRNSFGVSLCRPHVDAQSRETRSRNTEARVAAEMRVHVHAGAPLTSRPLLLALVGAVAVVALAGCSSVREARLIEGRVGESERVIHLTVGACNPVRIDTDMTEATDEVRVLVTVTDPAENEDCAAGVNVHLDEPLGDRTVLDASTGETVNVTR